MFIGHFGVGLGAKKWAPSVSIGTLFMAVQWLDLVWPSLLLLRIETVTIHPELQGTRTLEFSSYPYTHSLMGAIAWSLLFGIIYWFFKKDRRNAVIAGIAVFSHWALDFLVHFHDLSLYPGSSVYAGLGLWDSITVTLILEIVFFGAGIAIYLRTVRFKKAYGKIVFALLLLLLIITELSNLFGPPPASVQALAWSAQFQWLFILLAYWVDHTTMPRPPAAKRFF